MNQRIRHADISWTRGSHGQHIASWMDGDHLETRSFWLMGRTEAKRLAYLEANKRLKGKPVTNLRYGG